MFSSLKFSIHMIYILWAAGSPAPCLLAHGAPQSALALGPTSRLAETFLPGGRSRRNFFFIVFFLKSQRNRSHSDITWWLIPLSKWVITPVINGISRVNPLKKLVQCGPPSCVCWFRFAPVTSSLFAYHKP